MKFEIEEPDHELTIGYLTLVIKYAVLLTVSWIAGWVIFLFIPVKRGLRRMPASDKIDNAYLVSIFIAIIVVGYYSYRLYRKGKYGLLKSIEFHRDQVILTVINQLNGKLRSLKVDTEAFKVEENVKTNPLYGTQRIYTMRDENKALTILNIDLSAWNRHSELDQFIQELKKYS